MKSNGDVTYKVANTYKKSDASTNYKMGNTFTNNFDDLDDVYMFDDEE